MKIFNQITALLSVLILLVCTNLSQETSPDTGDPANGGSHVITTLQAKPTLPPEVAVSSKDNLAMLERRKKQLEKHFATLFPTSADYPLIADWILELDRAISEINHQAMVPNVTKVSLSTITPTQSEPNCIRSPNEPGFCLSVPIDKRTAEATDITLFWTKDQNITKNYVITKFIVEVAADPAKFSNGRFRKPIFEREVAGDGSQELNQKIPEGTLASGKQFYWQVFAVYQPEGSSQEFLKAGLKTPAMAGTVTKDNARSFKTAQQNFGGPESIGLTLQRTVAGDDATEAAEFGFLKTFKSDTVYTANFALIYDSPAKVTRTASYGFQASVQGSLTSEESESEDSLQFRAGAIINKAFRENSLNGFTLQLGAKYEADQKFKVGKFISENMITPTIKELGIGFPLGKRSIAQFNWRPFLYFDVGRALKRGNSNEVEDAVLRVSPRIRGVLTLHFLRRALNLNNTYLYFDNQFYYLPLEKRKDRNFFTSGFQLQITDNFGFGLTYKNGETAPKYERVNTFGGVLTIRFGKSEN